MESGVAAQSCTGHTICLRVFEYQILRRDERRLRKFKGHFSHSLRSLQESTMKVSFVTAFAIFSTFWSASASFTPTRISYKNLVGNPGLESDETKEIDAQILAALQGVGILSVTDVPSFQKLETLESLPQCMEESSAVGEHTFPDGTLRRTLATHSLLGEIFEIHHGSHAATSCHAFDEASPAFRKTVEAVTNALSKTLQGMLHGLQDSLLKTTQQDKDYFDVTSLTNNGEHLEHFHSYQPSGSDAENKDTTTIDWHIDQGLFLVFTPGLIASEPSDGFYIQLQDGSKQAVHFEHQDDLIILLGDGVNQILNPALKSQGVSPLRVPPHALLMPRVTTEPRVWYGRMVLPPSDAIHPVHHYTYGQLRDEMIENKDDSLALGCSSTMHARHLAEADCEADSQYFCWHRCFNLTDVTAASCETEGLDLACINDQRQLWNGAHDPQFFPGCVDVETATVAPNATETNGNHSGTHDPSGHNGTNTSSSSNPSTGVVILSATVLAIVSTFIG